MYTENPQNHSDAVDKLVIQVLADIVDLIVDERINLINPNYLKQRDGIDNFF